LFIITKKLFKQLLVVLVQQRHKNLLQLHSPLEISRKLFLLIVFSFFVIIVVSLMRVVCELIGMMFGSYDNRATTKQAERTYPTLTIQNSLFEIDVPPKEIVVYSKGTQTAPTAVHHDDRKGKRRSVMHHANPFFVAIVNIYDFLLRIFLLSIRK